jgi:hypothetical protein
MAKKKIRTNTPPSPKWATREADLIARGYPKNQRPSKSMSTTISGPRPTPAAWYEKLGGDRDAASEKEQAATGRYKRTRRGIPALA